VLWRVDVGAAMLRCTESVGRVVEAFVGKSVSAFLELESVLGGPINRLRVKRCDKSTILPAGNSGAGFAHAVISKQRKIRRQIFIFTTLLFQSPQFTPGPMQPKYFLLSKALALLSTVLVWLTEYLSR
jgi:hypothetical protein